MGSANGIPLSLWQRIFQATDTTPAFLLAIAIASVVFFGLVFIVHKFFPPQAKKWLTIICTFVAGLYFLLEYLWPVHDIGDGRMGNWITPSVEPVSDFVQYVVVWTIGLGIISLTLVHGRRLFQRLPGWHNSLAFFLAMIGIMVVGFWSEVGTSGPKSVQNTYSMLFSGLLINLDSAMFSLLAFYIASAAYRAFRVRTIEAALLMVSALVIMLGLVDIGVALTSWIPADSAWGYFRLERLSTWILGWINMPGQRAVTIGVAVGSLAMAMRLWLSLERGAFFSQES